MHVICDFDGTITRKDTTDSVLTSLAPPEWEAVETLWLEGRITAAECMRRQIAMIQGADEDLCDVLDAVELDSAFLDFVIWCESLAIPITIVSDGVDYFIHRILDRHGLGRLPVIANHLAGVVGRRALEQPWSRTGCAAGSGVCKCEAASRHADHGPTAMVFIGDGRSDFCVSARADVLFAKDKLAEYAAARGQVFHAYKSFVDIIETLGSLLPVTPSLTRRSARSATL